MGGKPLVSPPGWFLRKVFEIGGLGLYLRYKVFLVQDSACKVLIGKRSPDDGASGLPLSFSFNYR
jgi:hypothetical protein